MCKIMDPTEKGVWWKDDRQWVLYNPEDAAKILRAKRKGHTNIKLGPVKSERHPSGTLYAVDLVAMEQKNLSTGFCRDIKIVPGYEEEDESDEDDDTPRFSTVTGSDLKNDKEAKAGGKGIVSMVPSITVDLQKLSTQCIVEDECNLVLKLPKVVLQTERLRSLNRKTVSLLLEKLTRKEFIKNVVSYQMRGIDSDMEWKVCECKPYIVGGSENPDGYASFLTYLCSLAEEDEGLIDEVFRVAEKGIAVEGDRVEFVFSNEGMRSSGGYRRLLPPPSERSRVRFGVHVAISELVKGNRNLKVMNGAVAKFCWGKSSASV